MLVLADRKVGSLEDIRRKYRPPQWTIPYRLLQYHPSFSQKANIVLSKQPFKEAGGLQKGH